MRKLIVPTKTFTDMLSDLIASGVTFDAKQLPNCDLIEIIFTGGY